MSYLNRVFVITLFFVVLVRLSSQNETITWCVLSDAEEQKCLDFAVHSSGKNIHGKLHCTRAYNSIDCMEKIKNGTADAATMAADDIYAAGWCYGLELAAGESYNAIDGISYYVVAVARKSLSEISMLEMHERSSCHPAIQTTVGWTVPIGFLMNTSQISVDEQCNFPKAVGDFFGYSCVPGVKDPKYDPKGNNPKNLCEACIGDDNDGNICANDPSGATWCVAENLGDVAFVKHSTVSDTMNVKDPESWVKELELEDLKLLCPDGTEATLTEHRKCNLAAVPASAVVVRPEDKCRVFKFLNRAQRMFGSATQGFSLFDSSSYGGRDLMFTDGTRKLLKVIGSYSSWLGPSYTKVLQAFECEGVC